MTKIDPNSPAAAMKQARLSAGMTQKQLAAKSGVFWTAIAFWEQDKASPTLCNLEAVADTLGISIDEYVGHRVRKHGR